jgi:acetyltransferase-like isoleucine patch superfamily enzyme
MENFMISKLASIETTLIGENVKIGEFCVIRDGVTLGHDVIIHPHVVIEPGVVIGNGVEIFPGTYIGKIPKGGSVTARQITFEKKIIVGDHCNIGPHAVLYYGLTVGNNTLIGDGASLREGVIVGHHCLLSRYVTINYNTKIGSHTRIMDLTHITGNCIIGEGVFISVLVSTTNDNVVVTRQYDEEQVRGPHVHNGATVGAGACLLPGVTIGEGAFVGANAVVTKDVKPYDVVMGVPAQVIRSLKAPNNE